jgi:5-methylcytosine-specific restriction endonuclease McrA
VARIRTIKPEFWTDEKVVQLPYQARLLFIGLWNFADDEGYLWDEPSRIKLQVLPADDIDSELLIDLLTAAGLVERLSSEDDKRILRIPNFNEHQKVSNPAKSKIAGKSYKKVAIPNEVRRGVAKKYGCEPGGEKLVECYYCGQPGTINWWKLTSGKPGSWVTFSLELDHADCESTGGQTNENNIVLACRNCNRRKGHQDFYEFLNKSTESSRELPVGMEGNGREKEIVRDSFSPLEAARGFLIEFRITGETILRAAEQAIGLRAQLGKVDALEACTQLQQEYRAYLDSNPEFKKGPEKWLSQCNQDFETKKAPRKWKVVGNG